MMDLYRCATHGETPIALNPKPKEKLFSLRV